MKAVIDLETSGFSITKNAICEIGILIVNDALEVLEENSWIIKPYTRDGTEELCSYKDDAMAVHGIPMQEIENGHSIEDVVKYLEVVLYGNNVQVLIGHGIKAFDYPRLDYIFKRFSIFTLDKLAIEDTLIDARKQLNLPCNKLGSVCDHFGISNKDSHRALGDCYATLEVYKKLTKLYN